MADKTTGVTRRDALKQTGRAAAATALAGLAVPHVHAADDDTIRIALVGCGGRGTGAAANALATKHGPTKLVAMADVFDDRLATSHRALSNEFSHQVDVPPERRFVGFDGYQKAIACLRPGDVVLLATPPAFRWVHFGHAIEKDVHVFMEKPISVDGPSSRKMIALGEAAEKKNLKVGVGLMCRHCEARGELFDRIQEGQIGDLILLRAYRVVGPTASAFTLPKPDGVSELMYQIQQFHAFLWASGGAFSDFLIHNIDECCWMKNDWPVEAKGYGGRHYRGDYIDQNFDVYTVEYTFADGAKMMLEGRCMIGCQQEFASYAHGSKGSAVISASAHSPSRCRIYNGQKMDRADLAWRFRQREPSPYQLEWEHLMAAIRRNESYNEVRRGAEASLVTAMGRMAAHTGQLITREAMFNCEHEFAPGVDSLTLDSPAPLVADSRGRYPVPQPGVNKRQEYVV